MQDIRTQRDLERLPQPRLIFTAKPWVRSGTTLFLAVVGLGCVGLALGYPGPNIFITTVAPAIGAVVSLSFLIFARPYDWRSWVSVAAASDGLYLTAGRARIVFVPWGDVIEIGTERMHTYRAGTQIYPKITLQLPEAKWALFGNLSGIKGTGPIRTYMFSSVSGSTELMVDQLKTFRGQKG